MDFNFVKRTNLPMHRTTKKVFIIESLSLKPRARTPAASDPCLKGEWTIFIFHQPSLSRHCSALLTGIPAIFFCLNYKIAQLSKKVWPVPVAHREVCLFSIAYNLEKCRETYFLNHSCPVLGIFKFRPRRPYGVKDTFCAPWLDEFRDVGRLKIRQSVRILQTDFRFFFSDWDLNFCQAVPLRDRALFSKYFLSVLEFATKVLLTVWKSINPFGCYRRIFGFVLRAVDFACELKFFTHKKSILKVVSLIALAISFPLMPAKSLCD